MNDALMRASQLATSRIQHVQLKMLPELLEGGGALYDLCEVLKERDVRCAMIVTTPGFVKRGSIASFLNALLGQGITTAVFTEVTPDPDFTCIEKAAAFFRSHSCDAIVAIGGGSTIDCAKLAGALVVKPGKSVRNLVGKLKVRSTLPLLAAVPTTAGTGSEVTATALVSDPDTLKKRTVNDPSLIPAIAVLDPTLLTSLPPALTAYTGMDALSHAVEAYINRFGAPQVREYALQAVEMVFAHLKASYDDGKDLDHRQAMLTASYWAGIAFANASAGYAQALAHGLGGRYRLHHGLASAVMLPIVMEEYGYAAEARLADLGASIGLAGADDHELAQGFIRSVRELAASLGIPATLSNIREEDVPSLAADAEDEANPAYPTPVIWHYSTLQKVLRRAMAPLDESENSDNIPDETGGTLLGDVPDANSQASGRQIEIVQPGQLLDDSGRLAALGFARAPLLTYNRKRIKASPLRIKEWDYYLVNDDSYALALTIGDMGYVALVSASIIDFSAGTFVTQSTMDLLPLGKLGLPSSSAAGITSYKDKRADMRFEVVDGLRRLVVEFADFAEGQPLVAEVVLDQEPLDSMVIATPWAEDSTAFYYNQKIIGMRAIGSLTIGETKHCFTEDRSFGLLDWGRGVWTHDNTWYWSAAQGVIDGRRVGFNLGYGFGDTSAATENMLFVDGIAHKLGQVDFGIPLANPKAHDIGKRFDLMSPWHMTDDAGRLDLVFTPQIDRCDYMDFRVVKSDQHQVFGLFNGTVVLDDGTQLAIHDLRGFAEAVHNVY